jgi:methyltransferase FkbM-like protein
MPSDWAGLAGRVWGGLRASLRPGASFYVSHSQFGEDMLVRALLGERSRGFYVDLGAHHPIYYSNTYHFYCRGWRGLNVDARPGSMQAFAKLRPRDVNIEACLGVVPGQRVQFFSFDQPALNTCDPVLLERALQQGARLVGEQTLLTITLRDCLAAHVPPGVDVDFLSIDIEGLDEQILLQHDWQRASPRIIIFEQHGVALADVADLPVCRLLRPLGYEPVGKCGPSIVLSRAG